MVGPFTHVNVRRPQQSCPKRSKSHVRDHVIDLTGECDVLLRDPAVGMGAEAEGHGAPPDVDVRMVVRRLRAFGHPVHHLDGLRETRQLGAAFDRVSGPPPFGQPLQGLVDALVTE